MERFKRQKDIITDTKTGLVWQAEDAGPMTWHKAISYAEKLGDGWRLPTIEELITLINFSKYDPATELPDMKPDSYWSSSSYAYNAVYAWYVSFYYGPVYYYYKDNSKYVRCVR